MLNSIYQLKKPHTIEVVFRDIEIKSDDIIVRPTHFSICNADQRYYQGTRAKEILKTKLPMALIHEAIGKVVYDPTGTFKPDDKVVLIPNIPTEEDDIISENYLRSSKFRASNIDGFMQEYVVTKKDRLVKLPDDISEYVATFTEIVSVSYHAITRFERFSHARKNIIGVWGDGNLGFITSLLLKKMHTNSLIYIFGAIDSKLNDFTFADRVFNVTEVPSNIKVDHAFECVGGIYSAGAINQIIDVANPEGTISILGVSEELAPINTRMILEKGLRVFGSSRSGVLDYRGTIDLYKKNPEIVDYLENMVGSVFAVRTIADMQKAFEADISKQKGKTIMIWDK